MTCGFITQAESMVMAKKQSQFSHAIYRTNTNLSVTLKPIERKRFLLKITTSETPSENLKRAVDVAGKYRGNWESRFVMRGLSEFYTLRLKGRTLAKAMAETRAMLKTLNWRLSHIDYHFADGTLVFQDQGRAHVDLVAFDTATISQPKMQFRLSTSSLVNDTAMCGMTCVKMILTPKAYKNLAQSLQTLAQLCS